jgi:hypothetical protein
LITKYLRGKRPPHFLEFDVELSKLVSTAFSLDPYDPLILESFDPAVSGEAGGCRLWAGT